MSKQYPTWNMKRVYLKKDKVGEILMRKNKTAKWLASQLEVSPSFVSFLLSNKRAIYPNERQKLMDLFSEYSWDDLFVVDSY
jgi:plasmid maintenance system antidote protein VapI